MKKLSIWLFATIISGTALFSQTVAVNRTTQQALSLEEWKRSFTSDIDLFAEDTPLELTLTADFRELSQQRRVDEYRPAEVEIVFNDSISIRQSIRLKPRGAFRRMKCQCPPLKLDFEPSVFSEAGIWEVEKVKLVGPCNFNWQGEDYLLREHLIYKLYEQVSAMSFRTRLLKINYLDSATGKSRPTYAFLIEDIDDVAERFEGLAIEHGNIGQRDVDQDNITTVAMFQFMVGNSDWAVPLQHNVKLIRTPHNGEWKFYAVPYDFDYSGLVNATYAIPSPDLPIERVTQRVYQGIPAEDARMVRTIQQFLHKKGALYQTIDEYELLPKSARKEIIRYLDDFYKVIEKPDLALNHIKQVGINY